jgi:hypothetical protein
VGDELFDVPPSEFVAARTALVRELKAAGERGQADQVAALRRPTRSAWALNRVARHEPELIDAYLGAVAALREATDQALGGDATAVRPAQRDERAASDAVVAAATGHLERTGESATAAVVERVADSLRAAGADDEAAVIVRAGRLVTDLDPATLGFEGFGFGARASTTSASKRSASSETDRDRALHTQLERTARAAEARAAQMAAEADRARADADDAEAFATRARRAAEAAERRAEAAHRKAEQARARVEAKRSPPT